MSSAAAASEGFVHEALFYADAGEYLAGTVPFIREGLQAGEAVMVVVPGASLDLLQGSLDGAAERVSFFDMEELGRNPSRLIPAWSDFLSDNLGNGGGRAASANRSGPSARRRSWRSAGDTSPCSTSPLPRLRPGR